MIVLALVVVAAYADPVIDALVAEAQRSQAELRVSGQPAPYFVGYRMREVDSLTVHAQLGGIVWFSDEPWRGVGVQIRVGSPEFDNTNFSASGWSKGDGHGFARSVVDDAATAVVRDVWLETDESFKEALENYSRKKAAADRQAEVDDVADFAPGPPQRHDEETARAPEADPIVAITRELSALFLAHPAIEWSTVQGRSEAGRDVLLDSRGALVVEPRAYIEIVAAARTRAADGETSVDQVGWVVSKMDQLPDIAEMRRGVEALALRLERWQGAPREKTEYVGPILLEGEAAVTAFRLGLIPRLSGTPDPERPASGTRTVSFRDERPEPLRIRRRILPEGFTITDDPMADPSLPSSYRFDSEGEPAQAITLVANGIVRTHYASQTPSRTVGASNGHGRGQPWTLARGAPSWTRIESDATLSERKLHRLAIRTAAEYDLDSYVVIRHFSDPSLAPFRGGPRVVVGANKDQPLEPVDAVRVFADGHEEPFRGLALPGASAAMFRDVVATGASTTRTNVNDERGYAVTVTAPAVLLGEAELAPSEEKGQKVPRLANPLAQAPASPPDPA